ncbi:hypothetical protein ACFL27_05115 [candidate division CSSED10-310 bacterium]|uniref:Uncharacterized protein n=1 Tax=candidate division CSSED10-310 bacterium TaxID=2855610 RepID=A0ABV6YTS8_UNCC1
MFTEQDLRNASFWQNQPNKFRVQALESVSQNVKRFTISREG